MNIGEIRKNANGQLIGSVETLTITRTIGLRPVTSSNPRAPKYEIVALNDQRRWVIVGALAATVMPVLELTKVLVRRGSLGALS